MGIIVECVSHVNCMCRYVHARGARVLRHTVMDQTGLSCSVLCAVRCVPI